jgi:hypothetical protein
MKNLNLFIFILCSPYFLAQNGKEWGLEYRQKVGFLAAHRVVMGHLAQSHALAGELTYFQQTNGSESWHESFGFPLVGFTLFGGSVGNNEVLGTHWGAYSFMEFNLAKKRNFFLKGKIGAGASYGTRVFDAETNPKNVALSTHVNALICFALKSEYHWGKSKVTLGLDVTHMSNASSKVPNLGINLPYLSLGFGRTIQAVSWDSIAKKTHVPTKKWLIGITAIGSTKETYPTGGKNYGVFSLVTSARWISRPKVGFETSLDIISKQSIFNYKKEIQKTQWDILQVGIYAGYLIPLDKLHFVIGMGVYVKDKYQPDDFLYHRVGMRYFFGNGWNANLVLKSHWGRADYLEWGMGYTFNYKGR